MQKSTSVHHGNLRAEIITTAQGLLDEEGIEAIGIRKVARIIGVAHSAPANHFKNLKALLTALAAEAYQELSQTLDTAMEQASPDLRARVQCFANAMLDYGLQYPNRYHLLWRKDCVNPDDEQLNQAMDHIYDRLLTVLEPHSSEAIDIESQAIALWSLIHGYVSLRLDGSLDRGTDAISGEDRSTAVLDVLINGLSGSQQT